MKNVTMDCTESRINFKVCYQQRMNLVKQKKCCVLAENYGVLKRGNNIFENLWLFFIFYFLFFIFYFLFLFLFFIFYFLFLFFIFIFYFLFFVFYLFIYFYFILFFFFALWSRGSVLAFSTQVRGFKPGRSHWIFKGEKILSTPSFGGEVKPSVPCRRFAACKRSLNGVKVVISAKLPDNILAHSSTFSR